MAVEVPDNVIKGEVVEEVKEDGPEVLSQGTYAIYKTPEGGWHIAYLPSDTEETQHFEIPAMAVQLFQAMQRGEMPSPLSMMKKMMSNGG